MTQSDWQPIQPKPINGKFRFLEHFIEHPLWVDGCLLAEANIRVH